MTTTLYRPVGLKEMELIAETSFTKFPPRLVWQPIFYPVMNEAYAEQIAKEWNMPDEFSGYCGIVTTFEVDSNYLKKFEVQNVGGQLHNELWVPAEELEEFNNNIVGEIRIVKAFLGANFQPSKNEDLMVILKKNYES